MKKVLVLVPHHDDEVLGFGGSIAKHVRLGNKVSVAFLRGPYDTRSRSQFNCSEAAKSVLNYHQKIDLLFTEKELTEFCLATLCKLEDFLSNESPDILYLPHTLDVHQDHHQTLSLARIATRTWGPNSIPVILSGEIISSAGNAYQSTFSPHYHEVLEYSDIAIKQKALEAYTEEIKEFPHPRSAKGIEIYANKRGMEAGVEYAEAFEILRFIQK